ncbi:8441_t:CDS:1 [Dentiscutata erythropus]|uniref:8441_t:CDS:1 n=1 Tax=Dentiscutata erythropus TaxID=1348616 RepID=A0A9N9G863_9GLOM|nr:8441_t:CDS:1 [Dentiscutata erythropus]
MSSDKGVNIIDIYVKCLSEMQRQTLICNNINIQEDFKPVLFNYPKYLWLLNCNSFDVVLSAWCRKTVKRTTNNEEFQNALHLCNITIGQYILSHSAGLRTLSIIDHCDHNKICLMYLPLDPCVKGILHTFSKLAILNIKIRPSQITALNISLLCEKLSLYARNIKNLNISINTIENEFIQPEICKHLFQLINSQHKLQYLTICFSWDNSQSPLFFSALSSQSHSLKYLEIIQFYDIPLLISYLSPFNLDTLNFVYYYRRNIQIEPSPLPILHSGTQFRIKELVSCGVTHYPVFNPFFSIIIRMSGSSLQELSLRGSDKLWINAITQCPNLTSLTVAIDFSMHECFIQALSKLKKLQFLEVKKGQDNTKFTKDAILQIAKTISTTLEELDFDLTANQEYLVAFLAECKFSLSKLTIYLDELDNETLNFIIDYAIKTGNLKELCYEATQSFTDDVLLRAKKVIPIITEIGFGLFD